MKKLLLIASFIFCGNLSAQMIEEQLYVYDSSRMTHDLIASQKDLTIDHRAKDGFELYGPKGTAKWLSDLGISYIELISVTDNKATSEYPNYDEITDKLQKIAARFPKIVKTFSIGKTVQGRDLWMVKISDNVEVDELEPEFKYISSMHGNEITGRELTWRLIEELAQAYGKDNRITNIINSTEIYIMPSMNPDGSEIRRRENANRRDLNRNFPDWTMGDDNNSEGREPETVALMNFQSERNFSLSANFHGGAVVVNYPWDASDERHPFDSLLQDLSLQYADLNEEMRNSGRFQRGITNGADWYVLNGGMQDWSYVWHNDLQVTIELSTNKWPSYSDIPSFYQENKDSMITFIEAVHQGTGFKIKNYSGKGKVKITQQRKDLGTYEFNHGEFYKILPEGEYQLEVSISNKQVASLSSVVRKGNYSDDKIVKITR